MLSKLSIVTTLLLLVQFVMSQAVQITEPKAGSWWQVGQPQTIRWEMSKVHHLYLNRDISITALIYIHMIGLKECGNG